MEVFFLFERWKPQFYSPLSHSQSRADPFSGVNVRVTPTTWRRRRGITVFLFSAMLSVFAPRHQPFLLFLFLPFRLDHQSYFLLRPPWGLEDLFSLRRLGTIERWYDLSFSFSSIPEDIVADSDARS